jgi:dihydroorotate dehydrogenase
VQAGATLDRDRGGMTVRRTAYRIVRPLLFLADSEAIHGATLRALAMAGGMSAGRAMARMASGSSPAPLGSAPIELMGLRLRNRIGLGAGFDKDAVALLGWAALGFGFVEVGTVTPRPQPGNPRPRLERLVADEALVNRMGFNNAGAAAVATAISAARADLPEAFAVGVNIGPNRDTPAERRADDIITAARIVAPVADYLAVNVSSPNTPGLRELQSPEHLPPLLEELDAVDPRRPLLVELSADLEGPDLDALLAAIVDTPAIGVILSNTSLARSGLRSPPHRVAGEGGLSGRPLRDRMLSAVRRTRRGVGRRLVIIGSGGIGSDDDAAAALDAGADLVQLWTGLVYAGPGLIGEAVRRTADPAPRC